MLEDQSKIASAESAHALEKHPFERAGKPGALATAIDALFPIATLYIGRRKSLAALFGYRASLSAIKHWCRGRRRPPQWAIDTLLGAIETRLRELEHVRALLIASKKEKGPRKGPNPD